jgi:hypothetical protein
VNVLDIDLSDHHSPPCNDRLALHYNLQSAVESAGLRSVSEPAVHFAAVPIGRPVHGH